MTVVSDPEPPTQPPATPTPTTKKSKKRKKRTKSRHNSSAGADDATSAVADDEKSDLAAGGEPQPEKSAAVGHEFAGEQENGAQATEHGVAVAGELVQVEEEVSLDGHRDGADMDCMTGALAADSNRVVEWEFAEYVSYIETNNTLDLNCLEVVAGHGERPNKKKLAGEIREKKKTKGIPNKHLEPADHGQEYKDADSDVCGTSEGAVGGECAAEGGPEVQPEGTALEDFEPLEALEQKLDDREFNLVPEEVIRKDESKLREVEEAYTIATPDKKRDKHKKKKEKKIKGVRLHIDFEFPEHKRF